MNLKDQIELLNTLIEEGYILDFYQTKKLLYTYGVKKIDVSYIEHREDNSIDKVYGNEDLHKVSLVVRKKSWVKSLPSIYQDNKFLINFLFALQLTQSTQKEIIDNIETLFIPEETVAIDWLFEWFGISFGNYISDNSKRKYLYRLIELHKIRGTKEYLEEIVFILVNRKINIIEFSRYRFEIEIFFENEERDKKDEICQIVSKIIEVEKPAFTFFLGIKNCKNKKKIQDIESPIQQNVIVDSTIEEDKTVDNNEFDEFDEW